MEKSTLYEAALRHKSAIMQPYDAIMDMNSFDAICAFADYLGGMSVYVPSLRTIFSRCLELEIQREFSGANYAALCRKYGFTERHVRRLLVGK